LVNKFYDIRFFVYTGDIEQQSIFSGDASLAGEITTTPQDATWLTALSASPDPHA
jgi:hypothetical protein